MVAKIKTSFLKNSFQLFCHKHFMPKDVVHNSTTHKNSTTALNETDLNKKLSTSTPSLNASVKEPLIIEPSIRLSKKDKNILKIIHGNSTAAPKSSSTDFKKDSATANRSASLNYKQVYSIAESGGSDGGGYSNQRNRSPSPNNRITTNYSALGYHSNPSEDFNNQPAGAGIHIKQSKSHPNFSVSSSETGGQFEEPKGSPVQMAKSSSSREVLNGENAMASLILPTKETHSGGSRSSPNSDPDGVVILSDVSAPNGSDSNTSQEIAGEDLPDVIYVAYKKRSRSNNPTASTNSNNQSSSPIESENFKMRLVKSKHNNNSDPNNNDELLSINSSASQQQATLLPNGAILIEPPNINRNLSNRYSMPIMQSPVISNNGNHVSSQQQHQQQQQKPIIMNYNESNLSRNPGVVGKTTSGSNSDFIQFDAKKNVGQVTCKLFFYFLVSVF
jgi:hypothetical protein